MARRHDFFTDENSMEDDKIAHLRSLGYEAIDVEGNGHCGYYVTILGLQNLGLRTYAKYWERDLVITMPELRQLFDEVLKCSGVVVKV